MDFLNWIMKHWPELAANLGIVGSGGLAVKKMTSNIDKKQDEKISKLENRLNDTDKKMVQLKSDIETNAKLDSQFREQTQQMHKSLENGIKDVKKSLETITAHLLNKQ